MIAKVATTDLDETNEVAPEDGNVVLVFVVEATLVELEPLLKLLVVVEEGADVDCLGGLIIAEVLFITAVELVPARAVVVALVAFTPVETVLRAVVLALAGGVTVV